jgi:hypothetical protein
VGKVTSPLVTAPIEAVAPLREQNLLQRDVPLLNNRSQRQVSRPIEDPEGKPIEQSAKFATTFASACGR